MELAESLTLPGIKYYSTITVKKVVCKHCNLEVSAKIERIKLHLTKCLQYNSVASAEEMTNEDDMSVIDDNESSSVSTQASGDRGSVSSASETSKKRNIQPSMSSFTVKTSPNLKESLDIKVAKFFYANNIAFNAASSKEYREMIEALRPGYCGPSSEQIGGKILNLVCEKN